MQHVSHALSDRVAQYHRHNHVLETMEKLSKKDVWENWQAEVEAWRTKVQQQKERLEALGVSLDNE